MMSMTRRRQRRKIRPTMKRLGTTSMKEKRRSGTCGAACSCGPTQAGDNSDENQLTEWDEVLDDAEVEDLHRLVRELQPKLLQPEEVPAQELRFRKELVKGRPLIKFNAVLQFGEGARSARGCGVEGAGALWSCPGRLRPRHVPEFIIVTGHTQRQRGNMGVNGFYQRFNQDFHGRPVYQKIMERRQVQKSLVTEEGDLLPSPEDNFIRAWKPRSEEALVLSRRFQTVGEVPAEDGEDVVVFPKLLPSREIWFLFFDDRRGAWCIGPAIGATEVYAKCFTVEEAIPCNLGEWQMWDIGKKEWYTNKGLRLIKVG
ncbi:unnamed protein product [Effrenium voratum]|uniref:Uncharacterized protein n=1 Tax=Effrenium voratum TaxID=2562239 RepID=A0AA36JSE8_9DINO|nr:unnamed protein product [Effrenium voratum]CAJ1459862.1 unnamed protein product [Effrenium voratum]